MRQKFEIKIYIENNQHLNQVIPLLEDLLLEHVARLVVGVAFNRVAVGILDREQLTLPVVLVRLADAIRGAGNYLAGLGVFVSHGRIGVQLSSEVLARKLTVLGVLVLPPLSVLGVLGVLVLPELPESPDALLPPDA